MSDDDVLHGPSPRSGSGRPMYEPLDLPLDFEGFYLGHQEFYHLYAEIHLGSLDAAREVVHQVFLEIHAGWDRLLRADDLDQRTLEVLTRRVRQQLAIEGRDPAFLNDGLIGPTLGAVRAGLEIADGAAGLYDAILELPTRQFNVIVLRHILGYKTDRIARFMGLDVRTVDYHGRKGKERLRIRLGLPAGKPRNVKKGEEQ
ncbi:sigma factor-like helix-turn-helix DNA-binding protein [Streptomyces sp. NPDC056224]|uniref:sigma factor-like helix-turn-helix DNA-binding protein n=1 Tax=Streptomyces sp. NPDC056224 TaxID=3345750 RepID=UPI0035D6422A